MVKNKDNSGNNEGEDFLSSNFINRTARIAVYNDLKSAPRVVEVKPSSVDIYIENIASNVYTLAQNLGGNIPYTAVREVSENFIHAQFSEVVVSIFDNGNTIRFADQGPGIQSKETAKLPGFSSATEGMKKYIRGVGSGLPIVKEYLDFSDGIITIDDNLKNGAVVTISLTNKSSLNISHGTHSNNFNNSHISQLENSLNYQQNQNSSTNIIEGNTNRNSYYLSEDQKSFLLYFLHEGYLGVTDLVNLSGRAQSSTYNILKKLEDFGYIEKGPSQKRVLTDKGHEVAESL